ncbi:hypothetical protein BDZ89DRAFT_1067216, partial [Hymenopellis radicata]
MATELERLPAKYTRLKKDRDQILKERNQYLSHLQLEATEMSSKNVEMSKINHDLKWTIHDLSEKLELALPPATPVEARCSERPLPRSKASSVQVEARTPVREVQQPLEARYPPPRTTSPESSDEDPFAHDIKLLEKTEAPPLLFKLSRRHGAPASEPPDIQSRGMDVERPVKRKRDAQEHGQDATIKPLAILPKHGGSPSTTNRIAKGALEEVGPNADTIAKRRKSGIPARFTQQQGISEEADNKEKPEVGTPCVSCLNMRIQCTWRAAQKKDSRAKCCDPCREGKRSCRRRGLDKGVPFGGTIGQKSAGN